MLIGTNPDKTFPSPEGLVPGAGSILAALIAATDVQPIIMGKPGAPMFREALRRLATTPDETLMVGDRLDTDIAGAQAVGIHTALLLTGVTTRDELASSTIQADAVFDDLFALLRTLD
jgi:4-nitrophenyl phosphatase